MSENYEIKQVMYYEPGNKIWGWMVPTNGNNMKQFQHTAFAFWAVVGKSISVNKHNSWKPSIHMEGLVKKKSQNKYVEITTEQLREMWPNVDDAIEQKMLFMMLSDGFNT